MKSFIERVFKSKKLKKEKEAKVTEQATEAMVEAIIEEVKQEIQKEEVEKKVAEVIYLKPNHFPDCTCFKCERWRNQNAK